MYEQQRKIIVTKQCFLKKLNEIDKPVNSDQEEKDTNYEYWNKRDFIDIRKIRRVYNEQLYINILNIDEMEKFLVRHKLPKHTQEKIEIQNNSELKKLNL